MKSEHKAFINAVEVNVRVGANIILDNDAVAVISGAGDFITKYNHRYGFRQAAAFVQGIAEGAPWALVMRRWWGSSKSTTVVFCNVDGAIKVGLVSNSSGDRQARFKWIEDKPWVDFELARLQATGWQTFPEKVA